MAYHPPRSEAARRRRGGGRRRGEEEEEDDDEEEEDEATSEEMNPKMATAMNAATCVNGIEPCDDESVPLTALAPP